MPITVRMSDEDVSAVRFYARTHNMTLSEFARQAMLDKIEDEYDLAAIVEYEKEKENGTLRTYSHDEVWSELGL